MKADDVETWRRQKDCTVKHSASSSGVWFIHPDALLGTYRQASGDIKYRLACHACEKESSDLPTALARNMLEQGADLQWHRESPLTVYEPCVYRGCVNPRTEYHHFAPSNTFGREADNWPTLPLCRVHHEQWHKTMDGYRWNAKRVAS